MNFDFTDRVAFVTGSGQGIGFGIANLLAEYGAKVVVNDLTTERADAAVDRIGANASALPGDVSEEGAPEAMIGTIVERHGRIDILVNNAGIMGQRKRALDQSMADWSRVIDVNLRAPIEMTLAAARVMREQRSGSIVSISSAAGIRAIPADLDYGTSKRSLIHITESLALEFARYGIRVNCIAPGLIETPLTRGHFLMGKTSFEEANAGTPLDLVGQPEDIAHGVAFLVSDAARFITGVTLPIDGGSMAGERLSGRRRKSS